MKLTKTERWILSNQYRILELLEPNEADYFKQNREILESGYELNYEWITEYIYADDDVMSSDECREVINILGMFNALQKRIEEIDPSQLKKIPGIETAKSFMGFDGNNETKQMAYARFFCDSDGGRFSDLHRGDNFNSHMPSLEIYRRMLNEWNQTDDQSNLSLEDVKRISAATKYNAN